MILIVSLIEKERSLHEYEFVKPVGGAVEKTGADIQIRHYSELEDADIQKAKAIILCGTGLGDNKCLEDLDKFSWLKKYPGHVLGICVGADIISLMHGGSLDERKEIGAYRLTQLAEDPVLGDMNQKEVYELHMLAPSTPPGFETLARTENCVQAFRSPEGCKYGVLFHPEVRQGGVIERFCGLGKV